MLREKVPSWRALCRKDDYLFNMTRDDNVQW